MRTSLGKQPSLFPLSLAFYLFHLVASSPSSDVSSKSSFSGVIVKSSSSDISSKFTRHDTVAVPRLPDGTTITTDGHTYTFSAVPAVSPSALTTIVYSNGGEMVSYSDFIVVAVPETGTDTATATGKSPPPPDSSTSRKHDSTSTDPTNTGTGSINTSSSSASRTRGAGSSVLSSTGSAVSSGGNSPSSTPTRTAGATTATNPLDNQPSVSTKTEVVSGTTQLIPVIVGGDFTTPFTLATTAPPTTIAATGSIASSSAVAISSKINSDIIPLIKAWTDNPEKEEGEAAIKGIKIVLPEIGSFLQSVGKSPTPGAPCVRLKRDLPYKRFPNPFKVIGDIVHAASCAENSLSKVTDTITKGLKTGVKDVVDDIDDLKSFTDNLVQDEDGEDDKNSSDSNSKTKDSKSDTKSQSKTSSSSTKTRNTSQSQSSSSQSQSSSTTTKATSTSSCTKTSITEDIYVKCFQTTLPGGSASQTSQSCTTSTSTVSGCDVTAFTTTTTSIRACKRRTSAPKPTATTPSTLQTVTTSTKPISGSNTGAKPATTANSVSSTSAMGNNTTTKTGTGTSTKIGTGKSTATGTTPATLSAGSKPSGTSTAFSDGKPTTGPQSCYTSGQFGHVNPVADWLQKNLVVGSCAGTVDAYWSAGMSFNFNETSNGTLYDYNIWWDKTCPDNKGQTVLRPLPNDQNTTCIDFMINNYKNCNNGGIGGYITVGCITYQFQAYNDTLPPH